MHLAGFHSEAVADWRERDALASDRPGTGLLDVVGTAAGSAVSRAYATSPVRFLTPRNHGRAAWIYTASYGGGLVGGDAVRLRISVGPSARAFVSSQSSTKVYRSSRPTTVEVTARVAAGAHLVLWPDPVVCYAGSTYSQQQRFDVEPGGTLVAVDWMTSGRHGSGERWRFDRYETETSLRVEGRLVLFDSISLSGDEGDLAGRMGRFDVVGAAIVFGAAVGRDAATIAGAVAAQPVTRRADVLVSAAPLSAGAGCIVRVAGRSVESVTAILRQHLSFVPSLLGDDPWTRKW